MPVADPNASSDADRVTNAVQWLMANRLAACFELLTERAWLERPQAGLLAPVVQRERGRLARRAQSEEALFADLATGGVPMILLKGAALGRWLYPAPDRRDRLDVDLLVDAVHLNRLRMCLEQTAWQRRPPSASSSQETWHREGLDLDLHWRLSDHPVFFHTLGFDELWQDARPLAGVPAPIRALSPVHALVHCLIHYFGTHSKEPMPALFLVDLLLLWEALNGAERRQLDKRLQDLGLHGLAARAFELAGQTFPGARPDVPLDDWRERGRHQWQTALAEPHGRMQGLRLALRAQPGPGHKLSYLASLAFPRAEYMYQKYPGRFPLGLPGRYLYRLVAGLTHRGGRK